MVQNEKCNVERLLEIETQTFEIENVLRMMKILGLHLLNVSSDDAIAYSELYAPSATGATLLTFVNQIENIKDNIQELL